MGKRRIQIPDSLVVKEPPLKDPSKLDILEVAAKRDPRWEPLVQGHDLCVYPVEDPHSKGVFYALCRPTAENRKELAELTEDLGWVTHELVYSIHKEAGHERK